MAARELARGGARVILLEARDRSGGRILPLPAAEFGYPGEGGAEFVHGEAALTRGLVREAGLSLVPVSGSRWRSEKGVLSPDEGRMRHTARLRQALAKLETDVPVAEFLARHFAGAQYAELRRSVTRMVEGFDAADPSRASTFALREEWLGSGLGQQARIAEGYGGLIAFLASECTRHGATLRLGAEIVAIDREAGRIRVRCRDGRVFEADAAILTLPPPLLSSLALPPGARKKADAVTQHIGFGNVVKIVLRFAAPWWTEQGGQDLSQMSFLISSAAVPTWWTQHPASHPVLTGWLGGPNANKAAGLSSDELIALGVGALADIFGVDIERVRKGLTAARAINWGRDPFSHGAYSYATPQTRDAQAMASTPEDGIILSGEALYAGPEMGTVEAALASGVAAAHASLSRVRGAEPAS
jgi:monoamine oxidase